MRLSRRTLLQGLGALGAAGVVGSSLHPLARGAVLPARRLLLYVTSHGTVHDRFELSGGQPLDAAVDRSLADLAEDDFGHILQPLWRHRQKLLVLDGLSNYAGMVAAFNEHEEGHASALTGTVPVPVDGSLGRPTGPSIDQIIAQGRSTPISSLEWATGGWSTNFDVFGNAIPYEQDLWSAYARLFPEGIDPDGVPTAADALRLRQSQILSVARDRFDRLAPRLSGEDRVRLESHRDLLSDLSTQLTELAALDCQVPPEPSGVPSWYDPLWAQVTTELWFALAQAAFGCGATDVITIRGDVMSPAAIGAPPGDLHTDFAHNVAYDPTAADVMAEYHRWHADRFATLCDGLDAVQEDDGTMLDHTLCVWANELATGDHQFHRPPWVIAGGTRALASGRYVNFAPERSFQGPWSTQEDAGPPHNQALVTLARAMGMSVDTVGDGAFTDHDGVTFEWSGPLPGVLA